MLQSVIRWADDRFEELAYAKPQKVIFVGAVIFSSITAATYGLLSFLQDPEAITEPGGVISFGSTLD